MAPQGGIERRRLLTGALALAAGTLPAPSGRMARAQPAPAQSAVDPTRLRGGEILRAPDFTVRLRPEWMAARVRPHRRTGIRIARVPVRETPRGPRFLIHNYGHSGAGITLSWGSAARVADFVRAITEDMRGTSSRPAVAILGTGIIGLTSAVELRRRFPSLPITIYARDLDVRTTTSYVAGGQYEPSLVWRSYDTPGEQADLGSLLLGTRDWIARTMASGQRLAYGVAERRNYTLDLSAPNGLDYAVARGALACTGTGDAACRRAMNDARGFNQGLLPFEKLKDVQGREYFTWLINPRILMPKLVADLRSRSVRFERRTFRDEQDVMALAQTIIVNCTGFGARALFCDADLVPRRGHVVTIPNPAPNSIRWFFSGGCDNDVISYVFARQSDIVVGGTIISDDTDDRDNAAAFDGDDKRICEQLMANAHGLFRNGEIDCVRPLLTPQASRPAGPSARCGQQ